MDDDHSENHSQEVPEDDDPLHLKQLALNYDYLIYKINDHISTLSEQTYQSVSNKQILIKQNYLQDQLGLDKEMNNINQLIDQCNDLESNFMKLNQLETFVNDFKSRLQYLEEEFSKLD